MPTPAPSHPQGVSAMPYLSAFIGVAFLTAISKALQLGLHPVLDLTNIALLYLLPVLYIAVRWGRAPSIFSAILSVLAFDIFFVPPVLSLTVADLRYVIVFIVFLLVAFITGDLASRLKNQAETARKREERTAALYALSRQMAAETDLQNLLETVVRVVAQTIDGDTVIYMPDATGIPVARAVTVTASKLLDERERAVATWTFNNGRFAGRGTETLSGAEGLYVPLKTQEKMLGVLGVLPSHPDRLLSSEQRQLLEAFASLAAVAILRLQLAVEARQASHVAESEKLHTALFNSVSHDLRTPLASITGAVTSLQEEGIYNLEARQTLVETIKEGALRIKQPMVQEPARKEGVDNAC